MNYSNQKKQANPNASPAQNDSQLKGNAAASRATEDELEAFRLRGIPFRWTVAPALSRPQAPTHSGQSNNCSAGGTNEPTQPMNKVEVDNSSAENNTKQAPKPPFPS